MGFASLIHYGVQIPLKFDLNLPRGSSPPPSKAPVKASISFSCLHRHVYFPAGSQFSWRSSRRIPCARSTEQEGSSTSEETDGKATPKSCGDIKDVDGTTHNIPFVGNPNGRSPECGHDYVSSVRTIALWVCAAVAFGVVVVVKDGVGKASEFFAGCRAVIVLTCGWPSKELQRICGLLPAGLHKGLLVLSLTATLCFILLENEIMPHSGKVYCICFMADTSWNTTYLLEQSLSVDNLFVFVLIFKYFKVPLVYQVLSYGIAGAVIFRASVILLGTATLQRFEVVNLLLASILLYSSYKLFLGEEEETDLSNNFVVKTCQKFIPVTSDYDGDRFITIIDGVWKATPLLVTVVVIELTDIAFAVDSIPAVFGVTRDPFIVFSSNLFAILGLRSLYTLISESMSELEYLQPAIGVVLGFIGCKMILDFFGGYLLQSSSLFSCLGGIFFYIVIQGLIAPTGGSTCYHVSTEVSLGFVATSLTAGVLLSLVKNSD